MSVCLGCALHTNKVLAPVCGCLSLTCFGSGKGEECSGTGGADLGSHIMLNAAASNFNSTLLEKIPLILQNAAAGFSSQLFP